MIREPEDMEECSLVEYLCMPQDLDAVLDCFSKGRLSRKLVNFLKPNFPYGYIVEGYCTETLNEGDFVEQTIKYLH